MKVLAGVTWVISGCGYFSLRYSRTASDRKSLRSPSIKVGTIICGLAAVFGGELVALFEVQEAVLAHEALQFSAMRTRKLACER